MLELPDQSHTSHLSCVSFKTFQILLDVWYLSGNINAACEHEHIAILSDFNSFAVEIIYQCSKYLWVSITNEFSSKFKLSLNDCVNLGNAAILFFIPLSHSERMALEKGPKATKEDSDEKVLICAYNSWSEHLDFKIVCIISNQDSNDLCWAVEAVIDCISKEYS